MDVGQEQIAGVAHDVHVILNMQHELKVIAPVLSRVTVHGENGVIEEDLEPIEIRAQAIEHDDVWRDDQEVARELRAYFVELVEEAPGDQKRENFVLPAPEAILST